MMPSPTTNNMPTYTCFTATYRYTADWPASMSECLLAVKSIMPQLKKLLCFVTLSYCASVQWALELLTRQSEHSAVSVGSEACEKVLVACCQHSMLDRAMEVYNFMRERCHTAPSPQVGTCIL